MKNFLSLLLVVGLLAAGAWLVYFLPYYKDYYIMQEVTQSVALTWAAFNKDRAVREVNIQLQKREIDYITAEHCELSEHAGEFHVDCAWQVDVYAPLIGGRRLSFETGSVANKDGRLVND